MPKTVVMSQPTKETLISNLLTNVKISVRAIAQPADNSAAVEWFSTSVSAAFTVDEFSGETNKIAELNAPVIIPIPFADIETAVGKEVSELRVDQVRIVYSNETLLAFEDIALPQDEPVFTGTGELTITDFDIFMANFIDLED
jgi:hypothetical protein